MMAERVSKRKSEIQKKEGSKMSTTIVGAVSLKGVLKGEPEPVEVATLKADGTIFYLRNLREREVKARKGGENYSVYEADVLDIEGELIGTATLNSEGVMHDVDDMIAFAADAQGIPEDEAANLTYGPLKVIRSRRVYHFADASDDIES